MTPGRALLLLVGAVVQPLAGSAAVACIADVSRLNPGLVETKAHSAEVFAAISALPVAVRARAFFPTQLPSDFIPVELLRGGRWSADVPFELGRVRPGQRVRLLGTYVVDARRPTAEAFLMAVPPDTCGGTPAIRLDRRLPVNAHYVIVEGQLAPAAAGSLGRMHDLLPYQLRDATILVQGKAAVAYLVAARQRMTATARR
jgi:hypothetical protein